MSRPRDWILPVMIAALVLGASFITKRANRQRQQQVLQWTERVCDYSCKPQAWQAHCSSAKRCACLCADGAQIEYVPFD